MKRKIPPMPVEWVATHPKIIGMNTAAYGALMRLILHFWLTDCAPLPVTDHQRFLIARAHKPTWAACRVEIRAVLDDVLPELAKARRRWEGRRSVLEHLSARGVARIKAKAFEKAPQISAPLPIKPAGGFVDKTPHR